MRQGDRKKLRCFCFEIFLQGNWAFKHISQKLHVLMFCVIPLEKTNLVWSFSCMFTINLGDCMKFRLNVARMLVTELFSTDLILSVWSSLSVRTGSQRPSLSSCGCGRLIAVKANPLHHKEYVVPALTTSVLVCVCVGGWSGEEWNGAVHCVYVTWGVARVYACPCMCVCVCTCMCVCMHLYVYVCLCLCVHALECACMSDCLLFLYFATELQAQFFITNVHENL